ncbi:uncharacterized protein DEA37_0003956 [Paragonimus westermani]|uniref:Caprin-1 dimerization domain-containing protein n=1 Tax=Paragonimus westermani TaxID=34504 RepID=A0A5J4NI15_9TREM|nr:uncharacterized protein DEA37_0003956 [Paragonimus westermani]
MTTVGTPAEVVGQFLANLERRQRNLVKRKIKLDDYRVKLTKGETLNDEQRKAVDGYESVVQNINFVQEIISQAKELVEDVCKANKHLEQQKEVEYEQHTISYLHTHICLMRLLGALDSLDARTAIVRASSENQLKMLDAVRRLLTAPLIDNWPGTSSSCLANAPAFLQTQCDVTTSAQHTYDFVMGRAVPIPAPEDYDGSLKKFNFKEARTLCFRLLANPTVRRSIGAPVPVESCGFPENEEPKFEPTVDAVKHDNEPHASLHETAVPATDGHILVHTISPAVRTRTPSDMVDHIPAPIILDQVIKPLHGTFNFLQTRPALLLTFPPNFPTHFRTHFSEHLEASKSSQLGVDVASASNVMSSGPLDELSAVLPCAELSVNAHFGSDIPTNHADQMVEERPSVVSGCFSPQSREDPEFEYNLHMDNPDNQFSGSNPVAHSPQSSMLLMEAEPEPAHTASSKPISYADLVRRPGHVRPSNVHHGQQVSGLTNEARKSECSVTSVVAAETGDLENIMIDCGGMWSAPRGRGSGDFRGNRGTGRGFVRGTAGPRRIIGAPRANRVGSGPGRGVSGGTYRPTPTGVAQPSY